MKASDTATFWDHLEIARRHVLRSLVYLVVTTSVAWIFRVPIFDLVRYPAEAGVRQAGIKDFAFRVFEPTGGIVLMMQAALVVGVILASPLWLTEIAVFVSPGLRPRERKVALLLVPGAVLLFLAGAAFCFFVSPTFFAFLFNFNVGLGVAPEVTLVSYLHFMLEMVVVFGLAFELPLVIMFLVHFGIVSTSLLYRGWRLAVVIILIVAAVATPTVDPVSMTIVALPIIALYFLSLLLARIVEKRKVEEAPADSAGLEEGGPDLADAEEAPSEDEPKD